MRIVNVRASIFTNKITVDLGKLTILKSDSFAYRSEIAIAEVFLAMRWPSYFISFTLEVTECEYGYTLKIHFK